MGFQEQAQQLEGAFDHVRSHLRNGAEHRLAVKDVGERAAQNLQRFLGGVDRYGPPVAAD